ncbi:MAG: hypothetical protein ACOZCP_13090 [Pseudomonadota bacterium]
MTTHMDNGSSRNQHAASSTPHTLGQQAAPAHLARLIPEVSGEILCVIRAGSARKGLAEHFRAGSINRSGECKMFDALLEFIFSVLFFEIARQFLRFLRDGFGTGRRDFGESSITR